MASLTERFDRALVYASVLHREQTRKDTEIPYVSHLLAVASLVLEAGGTEDQAVAALLHDALEDHPDKTSSEEIAERFGPEIARLVQACSDVTPDEMDGDTKPPWEERKKRYLAHLEEADLDVLLVSCADKLHNARAILRDYGLFGDELWGRFTADAEGQLWYQRSLSEVFTRRLDSWLADEHARVVDQLGHAIEG